jgi:hypothetical protein
MTGTDSLSNMLFLILLIPASHNSYQKAIGYTKKRELYAKYRRENNFGYLFSCMIINYLPAHEEV